MVLLLVQLAIPLQAGNVAQAVLVLCLQNTSLVLADNFQVPFKKRSDDRFFHMAISIPKCNTTG